MTDIVEQAARVTDGLLYGPEALVRPKGRDIAQVLADAGLLAEPARTVPTRDEIAEAVKQITYDEHLDECTGCGMLPDAVKDVDEQIADAILELLTGQPTVDDVRLEAIAEERLRNDSGARIPLEELQVRDGK